jgi:membrane-bound inhibitor of C-type lysozyme
MTMLKTLPLAFALIAAASITAARAQTYYHYECEDGASFEVAFYPETKFAYLQFDGKSLQLPKRFSLTSQRFSQNGVTFSMKGGGNATIRRAGKTSQCKVK